MKNILLVFLLATSVSTCCFGEQKDEEQFDVERACLLFEAELARINAEIPHLEGQQKEDAIKRAEALEFILTTLKDSDMHATELQENTVVWAEKVKDAKKNFWILTGVGVGILVLGAVIGTLLAIKSAAILKYLMSIRDSKKLRIVEVEEPDPNDVPQTDRPIENYVMVGHPDQSQVQNQNPVPVQNPNLLQTLTPPPVTQNEGSLRIVPPLNVPADDDMEIVYEELNLEEVPN